MLTIGHLIERIFALGHPIELTWFVVNAIALYFSGKELSEARTDFINQSDELSRKIAYGNLRREATRVLTLMSLFIGVTMVLALKPDAREPLSTQAVIVRTVCVFVVLIKGFDSFLDGRERIALRIADRRRIDLGREARRSHGSRETNGGFDSRAGIHQNGPDEAA